MKYSLIVLAVGFAMFVSMLIGTAIMLWRNPDLSRYPAVTRCRLCGRRVWAWQSYERRNYKVTAENLEHIPMVVDMSGLVHCDCKGTPETTAKITSKGVSTPTLGAQETMGVSIIHVDELEKTLL